MKSTLLTFALAAQLAAFGAIAQTSTTTTGTTASGTESANFGSDWSNSLGSAVFGADSTTLRTESELKSQWSTLSDEDKAMIRRDCMVYMQHSGNMTGSTGSTTGTTGSTSGTTGSATGSGTTTGSASGSTSGSTSGSSSRMITVSMEQMEEICAATKDF